MTGARVPTGEATDANPYRVDRSPKQSRYVRCGGPRLDTDEWTLLTHIFLSNGSLPLAADHPDIQAIAPLLSRFAARRHRVPAPAVNTNRGGGGAGGAHRAHRLQRDGD